MKVTSGHESVVDPTLKTKVIRIGDTDYTMCLDLGSLAEAETALRKSGHDVSLLVSLGGFNTLDAPLTVFAAAIQRFHPEVGYTAARALLLGSLPKVYEVRDAISDLWLESVPEDETEAGAADADPQSPAPETSTAGTGSSPSAA